MGLYLEYWTTWPSFVIPNFILSIVMWTFFGRFILDLLFPVSNNYIKNFFHKLTDPFIFIFRPLIPGFLHPLFILLYIPFILIVLRFLNFVIHFQMGMQIIPDDTPS